MVNTSSRFGSYAVAVLTAGIGVTLPMVSKPFVGQSAPWISFIPAVLLSAWYGGFVPGLMTTGLLVAAAVAFDDTLFTAASTPASRGFAGIMFIVAALAVCLVIRAMRLAQAAALEAAALAKEAEARAQAQRDRLDVIVRDLPVGVVIANKEGKVELANPAAMEIHGSPLNPGDHLPLHSNPNVRTSPAGEPVGPGGWPLQRALSANETVVNEEIDVLHPDGATQSLMVNARPIESSAAIATYSDVTSLRAAQKALRGSEARLRRLFDSNIIGVVSGAGSLAQEANDGLLAMLGYTREDLKNGRIDFDEITTVEFRAADERARAQLIERGFSDPYEKLLIAADGQTVPVMVGAITFEPGSCTPWMAWVLDLSDHRRLEERVRQAAKAESIGLLAGGVAHDFNNLLTIIIGNASMANASLPENSPARHQIGNALKAAERAADLTRQLLAYAGKGRFIIRHADVSEAIREITTLLRTSAPRDVEIALDLTEGLPLVNADVTQLQQLVMNLVLNGVESLDEEGGLVQVSTSAVDFDEGILRSAQLVENIEPGRYVLIEVADNGCGMDAETRQRIFDPFFTTKFTGRGLGLAAAGGIVRAHQGGMIVQSTPGQGSTFQVFLPVVDSGAEDVAEITETDPVTAG
ncbi:MAG TPA: ATP-binding protein [Bryobacteraceae bacterium]|jgi:PAS domain S-box-containing protein|nr:ATP-binding protein [Bryobacteraceae bacterium]